MGKIKKIFGIITTISLFMFTNEAIADLPYDNSDPRVQQRNNKVRMTFFNEEEAVYTVEIFSSDYELIRKEVLGDAVVVGKIFDFGYSKKDLYHIRVSTAQEVLFNKRMRLGIY
ncbi:hypothetical protein [Ulvibacterium sp.]|uniref:hypothetical protein n=1 Tax=Ulvibacterium sp. TaxID=2665914 RepID=UPI00261F2B0C|nr:hypothetical protein [Ulvibacterium sp.]